MVAGWGAVGCVGAPARSREPIMAQDPRPPQDPPPRLDAPEASAATRHPDDLNVGGFGYYAVADLTYDTDPGENPPNQELAWADGYAVQLELANMTPEGDDDGTRASVAMEYARFEHQEVRTGTRAEAHYGTVQLGLEPFRFGGRVLSFAPRFLVGVGGLVVDHAPTGPDDTGGALASFGADLELRVLRHFALRAGLRWQVVGWPGDTLAEGGIAMVGGGVVF